VVIGCGALGTVISSNLTRAGIGTLTIIDRDIVELNNLQRQILFDEKDVGFPKVIAAFEKLKIINSKIEINPVLKDVNNSNIEELIAGSDLVLDATDNFQTRMIINDACVKFKIPWIYAGVIQAHGMTMNILPQGPCFQCVQPSIPDPGSMPTCETAGVLNTIVNIIASMESTEAIKILLKKDVEIKLVFYDVWKHQFEKIEVKKSKNCKCCQKKNFRFLESETREMIMDLCDNAFQIFPPVETKINLNKIANQLIKVAQKISVSDHLLKFQVENKNITVFSDGRAIVKGTTDRSVAKSIYSRYLGV
jgi:adenylyltransferase/sulfurtransferase